MHAEVRESYRLLNLSRLIFWENISCTGGAIVC